MRSRAFHSPQHRVLTLVEGDSLRQTVRDVLAERSGARLELEAHGRLERVRLRDREMIVGPLTVLSLRGSGQGDALEVRLVASGDDGALHAGLLDEARALELELALTSWAEDAPTPPVAATPPAAVPAQAATWADVAAASAALPERPTMPVPEVPQPRLGDRIVHPSFGETVVEKVDDEDFVYVRSKTQRLLKLSLDILHLQLVDEVDGRRRFDARVGKPKPKDVR